MVENMEEVVHWDLIIIGAGPAGLTAGIYGARSGLKTLIFEEKTPGGAAAETPLVENYPGFPDGITGPELMQHFRNQAEKQGTELVTADVTLQTWITQEDVARLEKGGLVPRTLAALVRLWTPFMHELFTGIGGTLAPDNAAFLHDPLTVLGMLDPGPLGFETLRIVPTIERGVLRTREAPAGSDLGAAMEVATSVDAPAARRGIVDRLLSL